MKKTTIHWLQYILNLPILFVSFFVTSIIASYLMISENWKDHLVFTPQTTTDKGHIYIIDTFIYAFKIEPIAATIFILSAIYLIGIIITRWLYWRKNKIGFIGLQLMIVIPIFIYTLLVAHSEGTMIIVEENWEKYLVFSPKSITDTNQIYYIDRLLYGIQKLPIFGTIFILSFLYIIGLIVSKVSYKIRFHKNRNTWGATRAAITYPSCNFYFCYFTIVIYCPWSLTL